VRAFLAGVADAAAGGPSAVPSLPPVDRAALHAWLARTRLAAAACPLARGLDDDLARRLRPDAIAAAAASLARSSTLARIEACLASAAIPVVLLKGAAVAHAAYADPALRPMTDLDLWIPDAEMPRAGALLEGLGYRRLDGLADRPAELQRRSGGEVVFAPEGAGGGLVELHYSAFQGWWVRRAAEADAEAVWRRAVPIGPGRHARRLAVEDAILQTSFHVVVNQFGQAPLRGLLDVAVMARRFAVDWEEVARRARAWRLGTATGLVLRTADALFGLPGAAPAMRGLDPSRARRAVLHRFVSPESVLAERDLTRSWRKHALLLALVDRPRDAARLVGRTLWPEAWWRAARYGRPVGPAEHLWLLARRGTV
jgi:hypothetical protein